MPDGIAAFWTWWKTARPAVEKAIAAQAVDEKLSAQISKRVEAVAKGMRWEIGPGGDGLELALTWDGDLARRRVAQRWADAAPRHKRWAYLPARPPGKGWEKMAMELGGHRVTLGDFVCTFEVDGDAERVHLVLHHPVGAKAGENVHGNAAFLMLDRAFGEDGVDRWLGSIEVAPEKPAGAVPINKLIRAVAALAKSATRDQFQIMQGERDGLPLFVVANLALKAIDHLACDHHVEIRLPILDATSAGLPTKAESERLDLLEDGLLAKLPQLAYHGRETHAGTRTFLGYAPRELKAALAAWAKPLAAKVTWTADPNWDGLRRWST